MATIPYGPPIANVPASITSPSIASYSAASHINDADFVTLTAGTIATSAVNVAANVAGIAQHDSNNVFNQIDTDTQGVFGVTQVGTGLFPSAPAQVLVVPLGPPIIVEMNLSATTGWVTGGAQQANIGTAVGLNKDATTGFFYADPTLGNLIAHVVGKPSGPNRGGNGDLGARVYVIFDVASALAAPQGH